MNHWDFLGQSITVGCFVASGGKGNVSGEYGMVLHKVVDLGGKVRLQRLTVAYPTRKAVFDAVCYAHSRGMNFAEALNEAVGHRNQRIVGPSLRELLESRAK